MGEKNAYRFLVGKLEKLWHRWKIYIEKRFKEIAYGM
jgi:hypothetical protein